MTESERDDTCREKNTRKRKITGRINEVMKRLRQQSNETGDGCQCKSFKTDQQNRLNIINNFNRSGCNVVPCSDYCRSVGHFGGYCVGPTLDTCHCYDIGGKN
ncbi:unnamed protein product [Diabrotica balteata]|uniref:Invertebrate defensins family profile domain-containing protein n=1 Tax=Diabrotica balteata TaxID=107213 RepID=A0A9N9TBN2_DIABA|nr:unnamed protein product [Diabrotica balteata]